LTHSCPSSREPFGRKVLVLLRPPALAGGHCPSFLCFGCFDFLFLGRCAGGDFGAPDFLGLDPVAVDLVGVKSPWPSSCQRVPGVGQVFAWPTPNALSTTGDMANRRKCWISAKPKYAAHCPSSCHTLGRKVLVLLRSPGTSGEPLSFFSFVVGVEVFCFFGAEPGVAGPPLLSVPSTDAH
jgi:hypothetical protein